MSAIIGTTNILAVQQICAIIVCKSCKIGLPSERSAKEHLTDKHSLDNNIARIMSEKAQAAAGTTKEIPHHMRDVYLNAPDPAPGFTHDGDSFLPPVEGIETITGFRCPLCRSYYTSEKGVREHLAKKHKEDHLSPEELWEQCEQSGTIRLQSLFSGPKKKLFPVAASNPVGEVQTAPFSSPHNRDTQSPPPHSPLHPSVVTTAAIPVNEDSLLADRDAILDSHKDVIDAFAEMENAFCNAGDTEAEIMRSHMNPFLSRTKFDVLLRNVNISLATAATYSGLLENRSEEERLVVQDVSTYLLNVPKIVVDIAPSVLHDINLRGDTEFTVVSTRAAERYARNFARLIISAIRVENVGLLPETVLPALRAYRAALSFPSVHHASRQALLHALLKSICLHRLDKMDSPRSLFVRYFIAFATVVTMSRSQTDSFRFAHASDISPVLAALIYGASSCALTEIHHLGTQLESLRNNTSLPKEDFDNSRQHLNDALEQILSSLEESQNSAASFVRKTLTIANTISKREDVDFVFDECQTHPVCGIVNNVHIGMIHLGDIVKQLHKDIRSSFSSLLHGAPLPHEFFSHLSAFQDVVQDKTTGFSFLAYGPNKEKCRKYAVWLFNQITNARPSGKAQFSPSQSTPLSDVIRVFGRNVRRKAVQNWLADVQDLQDKLLSCTHLSSGSPGRATELETLQLFNTPHALRNVYILQGRLVIVTRYSKTRTLAGWDKIIPRFPDEETSKLFLTYLVLFRSLETIFVRVLYGAHAMKSHLQGLFVERGTTYVSCRIRDVIRGLFHANSIPIEFNHFRHFAAGMVPNITENSPSLIRNDLIAEARNIAHLQAGHSPHVAEQAYARKASDIPSLPTSALAKYRMFSAEWHRHMGLLPNAPSLLPENLLQNTSTNTVPDLQAISEAITKSISDRVSTTIKEQLRKFNNKKRSALPDQSSPGPRRPFWNKIRLPPQCNSEQYLPIFLPSLRHLLKNPNAMFTSDTQLQVATAVFEGRDDLMVLMPTGSGKTLSILLPVFLEETEFATVFIVPLAALVQEHVETCRSLGLSVATWQDRHEDVQVYVISMDHNLSDLRHFLTGLQGSNKLRRIVIDEAHLLTLWILFRSSIQRLPYALKCRGYNVQIILLTATLPLHLREKLLNLLNIPSILLYAQPTHRPNLRFSVIDTSSTSQQPRFVSYEKLMTDQLCQNVFELSRSLLQGDGGRILIFALYKHEAERLQTALQDFLRIKLQQAFDIPVYHGGLSSEDLKTIFDFWKANDAKLKILIGTSAFGTGLHAPNVRAVFHYGGANGIVEYAQEAGRGGRDGLPALCVIIYNKLYAEQHSRTVFRQDDPTQFSSEDTLDERRHEWLRMQDYMTQTKLCRKNLIFAHVDGTAPGMCIFDQNSNNCDVCDHYHLSGLPHPNLLASQPLIRFPTPPLSGNTSSNPPQRTPVLQDSFLLPTLSPQTNSQSQPRSIPPYSNPPAQSRSRPNQSLSRPSQSNSSPRGPLPLRRRLSFGQSQENSNHNTNAPDSVLSDFRSACYTLQNLCVPCIVLEGHQQLSEHRCKHMRNRCRRCFQTGHQVAECITFDPRRKNYCYRCSLSQVRGENVHRQGEFGKNCFMGIARDIAWAFWHKDSVSQENLASSLFRDIELAKLQECQDSNNEEKRTSEFFNTWLRTDWEGVPNPVRFFLWWSNVINSA